MYLRTNASIWRGRWFGLITAFALLVPMRLSAYVVTLGTVGYNLLAGPVGFTSVSVEPDGSFSIPLTPILWFMDLAGPCLPDSCFPGVDFSPFPPLPQNLIVTSATEQFDVDVTGASSAGGFDDPLGLSKLPLSGTTSVTATYNLGCDDITVAACSFLQVYPTFSGTAYVGPYSSTTSLPSGDYPDFWNVAAGANATVTLNVTTVPEPGTSGLLAGLAALGILIQKRRQARFMRP
jgi:hypothetical protein